MVGQFTSVTDGYRKEERQEGVVNLFKIILASSTKNAINAHNEIGKNKKNKKRHQSI